MPLERWRVSRANLASLDSIGGGAGFSFFSKFLLSSSSLYRFVGEVLTDIGGAWSADVEGGMVCVVAGAWSADGGNGAFLRF